MNYAVPIPMPFKMLNSIKRSELTMLRQIVEVTEKFFQEIFPHPAEVVSIIPNNEGWELKVEVIIDDEYTRKRAKNDLIAVFNVSVNKNMEVMSYTREEIRERGKPIDKMML